MTSGELSSVLPTLKDEVPLGFLERRATRTTSEVTVRTKKMPYWTLPTQVSARLAWRTVMGAIWGIAEEAVSENEGTCTEMGLQPYRTWGY